MKGVLGSLFQAVFLMSILSALHAENKMTVEVYPLGTIDSELAEKAAQGIVSKDGKLVMDKANNRIILYDTAENQTALANILRKLTGPIQHVRIEVTFKNGGDSQSTSIGLETGHVRVGGVEVGGPGIQRGGSTRVQFQNDHSTMNSLIKQELLVMSGGKGRLFIGRDVPYADWFWTYGLQLGLWVGQVSWREVGASLVVEPYVLGDGKIRIRLTPEFSYILDSQTMTTAVEKLTTEVVVANGQEVDLGGLPVENKDFYSRFLIGFDHQGNRQSLQITLKPTIEILQTVQ